MSPQVLDRGDKFRPGWVWRTDAAVSECFNSWRPQLTPPMEGKTAVSSTLVHHLTVLQKLYLWWKCSVCCDTESRPGPAEPNRSFDVGFTVDLAPKQPYRQVLS